MDNQTKPLEGLTVGFAPPYEAAGDSLRDLLMLIGGAYCVTAPSFAEFDNLLGAGTFVIDVLIVEISFYMNTQVKCDPKNNVALELLKLCGPMHAQFPLEKVIFIVSDNALAEKLQTQKANFILGLYRMDQLFERVLQASRSSPSNISATPITQA